MGILYSFGGGSSYSSSDSESSAMLPSWLKDVEPGRPEGGGAMRSSSDSSSEEQWSAHDLMLAIFYLIFVWLLFLLIWFSAV